MPTPTPLHPFEPRDSWPPNLNSSGGALSESDGLFGFSPWDAPHHLSLSFVPDGTRVAGETSSLFAAFHSLLSAEALQQQVARAFQTWARRSNLNVGLVADDGSEMGAPGPTQGDPRFGDIRVAAVPMADDVYAVTIANSHQISGTWSGDLLFNSRATFASVQHFFAVALHEAGHVFGLSHSDDPHAVMHAFSTNTRLSAGDVANLRAIYGVRRLDPLDLKDANDSPQTATRIENPGSPHGANPLVVYGDIRDQFDQDYFELKLNSDAAGPLRFIARSAGRSLLQFQFDLFDEQLQLVGSAAAASGGSELTLLVPQVDPQTTYFARLRAVGGNVFSTGSYSLAVVLDDQVSARGLQLLPLVQTGDYAFLPQHDIRDIFENDHPHFNDDGLSNDTPSAVTDLETITGYQRGVYYRVDAGLAVSGDVDYYRFRTPEALGPNTAITLALTAFERDGLIAAVQVFDPAGQQQATRVLVNGNGELVLQFAHGLAAADYVVRVAADPNSAAFATGNYRLQIRVGGDPLVPALFATGTLSSAAPVDYHNLFVARTQMFHLGLTARGDAEGIAHNVWTTILAEDGTVAYRGLTVAGETRTRRSIVLKPGTYLIKTELVAATSLFRWKLDYQLEGTDVDQPTGPELVDVASMPFQPCPEQPTAYCYPGGTESTQPYIIVNGKLASVSKEPTSPPPLTNPSTWYWNTSNAL